MQGNHHINEINNYMHQNTWLTCIDERGLDELAIAHNIP